MSGFWYLATPYTKYPLGREAAFEMACRVTAELLRRGVAVFSPIAHSHPVATIGGIAPDDHAFWIGSDLPMMQAACGLIVLCAEGWRQSRGMAAEVETFSAMGKPIVYLRHDAPLQLPEELAADASVQ